MTRLKRDGGRERHRSRGLGNQSSTVEEVDVVMQKLGTDLLVEVLSYLPQKHLYEVMLESQEWNTAVTESAILEKSGCG